MFWRSFIVRTVESPESSHDSASWFSVYPGVQTASCSFMVWRGLNIVEPP